MVVFISIVKRIPIVKCLFPEVHIKLSNVRCPCHSIKLIGSIWFIAILFTHHGSIIPFCTANNKGFVYWSNGLQQFFKFELGIKNTWRFGSYIESYTGLCLYMAVTPYDNPSESTCTVEWECVCCFLSYAVSRRVKVHGFSQGQSTRCHHGTVDHTLGTLA